MNAFRGFLVVLAILFLSAAPARAQCVITAHAQTIANVSLRLTQNMFEVSYWLKFHLLDEHIKPTFAKMTQEWSTAEQANVKGYSEMADSEQTNQAVKLIEEIKTDAVNKLRPSEELCVRISQGLNFLPSYMKAQSTEQALLGASTNMVLSEPGSPANSGRLEYVLARWQHYANNACDGTDLGGSLSGICALADAAFVDSDIDPELYFSDLTVEEIDPESSDIVHLNAFTENVCGGFVLSFLQDDYFNSREGEGVLLDAGKFWQYSAFCRSSVASYASWRAPGQFPLTDQQRAMLITEGYEDDAEIDSFYGEFPSLNAQTDLILKSHTSPKGVGLDQMAREEVLLGFDAMSTAMELTLWERTKDIYAQETRNLSLALALALREPRESANSALAAVSSAGRKGR